MVVDFVDRQADAIDTNRSFLCDIPGQSTGHFKLKPLSACIFMPCKQLAFTIYMPGHNSLAVRNVAKS